MDIYKLQIQYPKVYDIQKKNTPNYINKKGTYKNYTVSQKPSQPNNYTNTKHKKQSHHTRMHTKLLKTGKKHIHKKIER